MTRTYLEFVSTIGAIPNLVVDDIVREIMAHPDWDGGQLGSLIALEPNQSQLTQHPLFPDVMQKLAPMYGSWLSINSDLDPGYALYKDRVATLHYNLTIHEKYPLKNPASNWPELDIGLSFPWMVGDRIKLGYKVEKEKKIATEIPGLSPGVKVTKIVPASFLLFVSSMVPSDRKMHIPVRMFKNIAASWKVEYLDPTQWTVENLQCDTFTILRSAHDDFMLLQKIAGDKAAPKIVLSELMGVEA